MSEGDLEDEVMLSIVVPTYNGEDYLAECLDSILSQTFSNYEVICVDDGSTDTTSDILADYKERDARFKVFRQENLGVSAARNYGLAKARGKYVSFLDDDDLYEPEMFELMVHQMEEDHAETCWCGGWRYDVARKTKVRGNTYLDMEKVPEKRPFTAKEAGKYLFQITTFHMFNKMYSVSFLRREGIEFEPYKISEDAIFNAEVLLMTKGITVVDKPLVTYRVNSGTSVSASVSQDILAGYRSMLVIRDMLQERETFCDGIRQSFVNKALSSTFHYCRQADTPESFALWFDAMKGYGLEALDIIGHDESFFYSEKEYEQLDELLRARSSFELLFWYYRRALNSRDDLRAKNRKLKLDKDRFMQSRSYKLVSKVRRLKGALHL